MCGICGKLNFDRAATIAPALCKEMADTIRHRGPDDEGYYVSGAVGLGFRRLSIIDLNTGHQPLSNEDGTIWIVFNGEIYNYQDLRQQLLAKGHVFRTKTDTEVIVHLYEEYGESCVEKLRGMFAFAVWDDRQKVLLLARDRVGIKPLYYRLTDKSIIFGSEIKTILADPEVRLEVIPGMIDRFLTFYYTPGEETLFKDIRKLAPGSHMVVRGGNAKITQYWDLRFSTAPRSIEDAERELLELLEESVRLHMISDVPLGFLLSGGVDSTAMLGLAVGKTEHTISSFTIGFSDPGVTDERPYARLAAARYGSEHHEMTIGARDFADFLPHYIWHMEEPVCEPPAVALFYISKLAKQFVKVLISGEGGDEAFAGYPNYRSMLWLERLKHLFKPLNMAFPAVRSLFSRFPPSSGLRRYAQLLDMPFDSYYYSRTSTPFTFFNSHMTELYSDDFLHLADKNRSVKPALGYLQNGSAQDTLSKMLYVDTKTWLPDDLLIKADRMTMANSVELRVPLLDHKILEFAASLQGNYKVRGFATKYIAKKALSRQVPREILDRKKTGFPVPYDSWMRNELKGWLRDILLDRETSSRGYFRKSAIEKLLVESTESGRNSKELFSLAVLELWHRQFLGNESQTSHPPSLDPSEDLVARS
ncbi:MAG: asparagine synthase (glutamine-hydrolyzing) [Candidatus Sulfotelmatobacter sp.]